jgi:uncharacterized protein YjiS (DUF1127 family)
MKKTKPKAKARVAQKAVNLNSSIKKHELYPQVAEYLKAMSDDKLDDMGKRKYKGWLVGVSSVEPDSELSQYIRQALKGK